MVGGGVFINYRGADSHSYGALLYTDLVRRFGEDLVFLDAESIPAGADYVQELLIRVRSAGVVLAVVGPNWLTTGTDGRRAIDEPGDWIRRELVEAFAAGVQVIPVLTDGAEPPDSADLPDDIAALGRCQARHLRRREPSKDLDRLASDLAALIPELASAERAIAEGGTRSHDVLNRAEGDVSGQLVQAGAVFGGVNVHMQAHARRTEIGGNGQVWKLPGDTGVFVGRVDELAQLEQATVATGRVVVVAVHGLGGVGKSTLVARFTELHGDRFSQVWWITADSAAAIDTGLAELAEALKADGAVLSGEQPAEQAIAWLAGHTNWLLVLDNLTTSADATRLLERIRTGTILITSRQSTGWRGMTTVRLDVLSEPEAVEMLDRTVRADWPDPVLNGADRLCAALGRLPLAIEQAGAYIAQTRITSARYLQLLERFPRRMFTAAAEGNDAQRTMARVWHLTLDRLTDTPMAGSLLQLLAWFAPDQISRTLIEHPGQEPDVGDALGRLAAYNMITLTVDSISVHRLVQVVTRTPDADDPHRQPDDILQARDAAAIALAGAVSGADPEAPADWPRYRTVLPHALALLDHTAPHTDTEHHRVLTKHIGIHLIGQGNFTTAISLLTRAVENDERLDGADHPRALKSRNNLAAAYEASGDFGQAVQLFEATAADTERVFGPDHPETLQTRNNLAYAYRAAGDPARAIRLHERTLPALERVLGPDHPNTLGSQNNLAGAYVSNGDLEQAIPLYEKTLADRKRVLGADHPHTLVSQNDLAHTYVAARDLGRAIPLYERTLADRERVLGADHPDTLISRNSLANAYQVVGDLQRAIPLFEATLADLQRVIGADHPNTLMSQNDLAYAYQLAGDLDRAIPLFEATLADAERVLGVDHPQTLRKRFNLAVGYWGLGDLDQAIPLLERTLVDTERVLGPDDGNTRLARRSLLSTYQASGDLGRAAPLLEKTLTDRECVLGVDHPDTLMLRSNLATAYWAEGDRERAIQLFEKTLADAIRVLGAEHPITKAIHSNHRTVEDWSSNLPPSADQRAMSD